MYKNLTKKLMFLAMNHVGTLNLYTKVKKSKGEILAKKLLEGKLMKINQRTI
jgi:hypothetical protein